jgi:hypothetical protein
VLVLVLLSIAGCGENKAATRPEELFETAPAGYRYKVVDSPTTSRVLELLKRTAPSVDVDDISMREMVRGKQKTPLALAIVIDAHNTGGSDDAMKEFDASAKAKSGKSAEHLTIAGSEAGVAEIDGTTVAVSVKNGYALEAIAADEPTVKVVLARLIFAAGKAER